MFIWKGFDLRYIYKRGEHGFFLFVLVVIYICIILFTTIIYLIKLMNNYGKINYRLII